VSSPSYITFSRGAWHLRCRYVDSIGRTHWPRERSPYPADRVRSRQWAPLRRAEIIAAIETDILRVVEEAQRPVTLRDVMQQYETDCRERGTRWQTEAPRVKVALRSLGADTPASTLTSARIAAWRAALRQRRRLSARSCNAYTALVSAALNLAVARGILPENPMRALKRLPEPPTRPRALSERQVAAIMWACRVWERWERRARVDRRRRYLPIVTRVMLGYWTGGRPEAIDALRWRDLDLRRRVLVFPLSKRHRNIVVPLEPELVAHLAGAGPAAPDRPVLVAPRSGRAPVNWRPPWLRLLRIADHRLPPAERIGDVPLHVLRHSRITHLLVAGVSPQVVAQVTGTSLTMLQRHYAHVMVRGLEDELARARRHPVLRAVSGGQKTGQRKRHRMSRQLRHAPAADMSEVVEPEATN